MMIREFELRGSDIPRSRALAREGNASGSFPAAGVDKSAVRSRKNLNVTTDPGNHDVQVTDGDVQVTDIGVQLTDGDVQVTDIGVQLTDGDVQVTDIGVQLTDVEAAYDLGGRQQR